MGTRNNLNNGAKPSKRAEPPPPLPMSAASIAAKRIARHHRPTHVVFLSMSAPGHIFPVLPLIEAMIARGYTVTVFVAPSVEATTAAAVTAAGANLRAYRNSNHVASDEPLLAGSTFRQGVVRTEMRWLPALVDDLRELRPLPSVVLYDTFITTGAAAAAIAAVPSIGLCPHGGPGWMNHEETKVAADELRGPREWLHRAFGLNLLAFGHPPLGWYGSSTGLNLVLACQEMHSPPTEAQRLRLDAIRFHCVGTMASIGTRRPGTPFPFERVMAARDAGRRVVLLSLGTLVTGAFWSKGSAELPGTPLGAPLHIPSDPLSGREFAQSVWSAAMEAFGRREDLLLLLVTGPKVDTGLDNSRLDGLRLPPNFLAFPSVPQLELLPMCDAFITHGGMGSIMEAVLSRVRRQATLEPLSPCCLVRSHRPRGL